MDTRTINCFAQDINGLPIPGLQVHILDMNMPTNIFQAYTDEAGQITQWTSASDGQQYLLAGVDGSRWRVAFITDAVQNAASSYATLEYTIMGGVASMTLVVDTERCAIYRHRIQWLPEELPLTLSDTSSRTLGSQPDEAADMSSLDLGSPITDCGRQQVDIDPRIFSTPEPAVRDHGEMTGDKKHARGENEEEQEDYDDDCKRRRTM